MKTEPSAGTTVVLVGAPGSGKTTVGRLLARLLDLEFRDVDAVIEADAGKSVQDIFADDGEPAFRELEVRHTLAEIARPGVVSLGGGAVMSEPIRAALAGLPVVWLKVSGAQAARRVGLASARPLLLGNVRSTLLKLLAARTPVYAAVSGMTVDTDTMSAEQVARHLAGRIDQLTGAISLREGSPVVVEVAAERPYEVVVGHDLLGRLPGLLPGAARVAILHPASVAPLAARAAGLLTAQGITVASIEVADAEQAKTVTTLARCWDALGEAGLTRSDAVVGIGGGATTDLAGFVAATWLRGVRLVTVPTTLLGMVDAAVGGKTAINIQAGKNLVGAFHEPVGVLCDLDGLATLGEADLRAGLAEVIKTGFILDPAILDLVERAPRAVQQWNSPELAELVVRSVRGKAHVVSADLREATSVGDQVGRELLNYGHTLGHAIERREHFAWRHGEAVSVGLVFVAELARLAGRMDDDLAARHARLLGLVGLPVRYDPDALPELLEGMALDKKTRGTTLRFVVLTGIGQAEILAGPDRSLLERAYAAVAE